MNKIAFLDDRFQPKRKRRKSNFKFKPNISSRQFNKVMKSMTLLLSVVFVIMFCWTVYKRTNIFSIEEITVEGTEKFVNKEDMLALITSNIDGKTYLNTSAENLQQKLTENFQGAKNIKVTKVPFSKIKVTVVERRPLALISSNGSTFMIDDDGYVLGLVQEDYLNLPQINYTEEVRTATFIETDLVPVYLDLINELNREDLQASSISVSKRDLTLYTDSVEVFLSRDREISESVRLLNTVLKQVFTNGEKATRIDLRYEKVIVSYE
ncbi:MAG: cell division protein FtsQ/DivIB [Patescibacteria group bacterium]